MENKKDRFEDNIFTSRIRITDKTLEWIRKNKKGKSGSRFLDDIIKEYIKIKKQENV